MLIIANWKMNLLRAEAAALAGDIVALKSKAELIICPSSLHLESISKELRNSLIMLGGQDCSAHAAGAHTGEVSAAQLSEMGCKYVILGHSERRKAFAENYILINSKAAQAIAHNLTPIICVGEQQKKSIKEVIAEIIAQIKHIVDINKCIVAYEPSWAIGTDDIPAADAVKTVVVAIRDKFGPQTQVVYGGSVNAENIENFAPCRLSGFLLGGSSQKIDKLRSLLSYITARQ